LRQVSIDPIRPSSAAGLECDQHACTKHGQVLNLGELESAGAPIDPTPKIAWSPLQSSGAAPPRDQSSRAGRRTPTLATGRKRAPARSRNLLPGSGPSRAWASGPGAARTSARRLLTRAGSA